MSEHEDRGGHTRDPLPAPWEALSDFAAAYPLHLDCGENGEPLTRGRLRGVGGLPESGDDSELVDNGDGKAC